MMFKILKTFISFPLISLFITMQGRRNLESNGSTLSYQTTPCPPTIQKKKVSPIDPIEAGPIEFTESSRSFCTNSICFPFFILMKKKLRAYLFPNLIRNFIRLPRGDYIPEEVSVYVHKCFLVKPLIVHTH